jgi:DNA-binding CsgD family transcriptional regulator
MQFSAQFLDCLASAYRLDLEPDAYIRELVEKALPILDAGVGLLGYTYDARDRRQAHITHHAVAGVFRAEWLTEFYTTLAAATAGAQPEDTPTGFDSWRGLTCEQATAVPGMKPFLPYFKIIGGSVDTFAINALDASGFGLWLGAPMLNTRRVPEKRRTLFTRFAAHLASAFRMRRVGTQKREAVLSPNGKVLHAEHEAKPSAMREELRLAAVAFDQARSKFKSDAEHATRRWRPLVETRWSLIDEFDTDGKRFVIAVENTPPVHDARSKELSARELQVLTHAHLGHSNKVIAYELGLAASTVRVLLQRAAQKLGARTRADAITRFDALVKKPR